MLEGISIHGYVCRSDPQRPNIPVTQPNTNNLILRNDVRENGGTGAGPAADGIGILQQGPLGIVCVSYSNTVKANTSSQNVRDGIFVGGRGSGDNLIEANIVNQNGRDGIRLEGPPLRDGQPIINPVTGQPWPGAIKNTVIGNRGYGNGEHDGHDGNPNCDNNVWLNNRFLTVNQPCVGTEGNRGLGGPGRSKAGGNSAEAQAVDYAPRGQGRRP